MGNSNVEKIRSKLEIAKAVLIIPSRPADLDSISTSIALKIWIKNIYKINSEIYFFASLPETLVDLANKSEIKQKYIKDVDFNAFDVIFLVDGNDWMQFFTSQFYKIEGFLDKSKIVNIDHHEAANIENDGDAIVVRKSECSTGKILFDFLIFKEGLTSEIAELLMSSLISDTNRFSHAMQNDTFAFAQTLVDAGANYVMNLNTKITQKEFLFTQKLGALIEFFSDLQLCMIVLNISVQKEISQEFGDNWQTNKLDDFFKQTYGGKIKNYPYFFLLRESLEGNMTYINWRTDNLDNKINMIELFSKTGFWSAGHKNAGVARINRSITDSVEIIKSMIRSISF